MRLKQLEIKGFKSFANETKINFNEDVIGIVGPNGSGKSNIVDAIRWVLGEQKSKELRLDQMSSVIFNGTKKKKPSGMASVSLTFENTKNILPTEYQTVTITRILYRTGESEYRLNNVACRLKDITTLFLDTGIGSNSYAIIALGMVDDILNDKDNARRRMFEQAAGVSKYKVRKRETLNKLKSTEEDLNRVEDLLFEIQGNLGELEKQAKRAKRYFVIKDQYKSFSIALAVIKIKQFKGKQTELNQKLTEEEDRYRQCEIAIRKLEAKLESERKAVLDEEKALSERQRNLNRVTGQIRGKENDKRMLEQKLQFVAQNKSKLAAGIENAEERILQLEEDVEFYRSNIHLEKHKEFELEEALDKLEEEKNRIKSNHHNLKSDLDTIMGAQRAIEQEVFELEKQKAINNNQLESFRLTIRQNEKEIASRIEETKALREKVGGFEAKESELSTAFEALESKETNRVSALEQLETEREKINFSISKVNRELDAKRNEYKLTKSMIENLEGFPESIRFLKNNKKWGSKAPLLTDIVYVKEAYRTAIENYLEPYLNYYVVKDVDEAISAIHLLGESQKGKAHFFVMDAFTEAPSSDGHANGLKAIDLIETDAHYLSLFRHLLANVTLIEENQIQATLPRGELVEIAQDGSFTKSKWRISGGSVGLFEGNKIGRKKNLEVLDKTIKEKEKEAKKLSTSLAVLKQQIQELKKENYQAEIQRIKAQMNKLAQEKISFATRLENFEQFINQVEVKSNDAEAQIKTLEEKNQEINVALSAKQLTVIEAKEKIANTDDAYREIAEKLSQASAAFNEKNIAFIQQQNKVSSIQRDLSYREKELESTKGKLVKDKETLANSDGEIKDIQDQMDRLEEALKQAYVGRKEMQSTLSDAEQQYFKARGAINEIEDELRKQQKVRMDAQVLVNQYKDKVNDMKYEISSISQRLRIEFEEEINYHINQPVEVDLGQDELQAKVERLKSRLDNYGEINPMAVQAYDEMKERHDNITQQRDDILEAKSSLQATIQEIEETATKQFIESFDQARLYFINVFRSLFTADDSCDLILLDPENPLDSKIEIVAKPKGKRPQSISQLSGGEKTLTATALLFSLYLLKPAPFCIFDEVDAPLDDANISKFNNIIKKFSKESQFIIVTHNKLTMAAVDTIYGVYMAEQGVSAVSSVDFRNFEHSGTFEVMPN